MNSNRTATSRTSAWLPAMVAINQLRDQACTSTSGTCPMAMDAHRTGVAHGH